VKFNIKVPNNTPVSQLEKMLSVRWGVSVTLRPGETHVWLPNKTYEFVSVVPSQKAAMTEEMIRQQEQVKPPVEIDLMVTIRDGNHRFSEPVRVPSEASWDQVLMS
jgi:hypothetical protein